MNILAIDTCTDVASVTLYSSGVKISRKVSNIAKSSGHILKLCEEVFSEAETKTKTKAGTKTKTKAKS